MTTFKAAAMDNRHQSIRPVIAVDLGFAGKGKKSTGVAVCIAGSEIEKSKPMTFAAAIQQVCKVMERCPEAVLILEAPLSGTFDEDGNPMGRLPFEKQMDGSRYWYCGAGAATCLAAGFFLKELANRMAEQGNVIIYLVEGFVSFKKHAHKLSHAEEAVALVKRWLDARSKNELAGLDRTRLRPLIELIGLAQGSGVPPVIALP